jgi:hypothetical protein
VKNGKQPTNDELSRTKCRMINDPVDSPVSKITADISVSMGIGKDTIIMQAITNTGESGFMLLNTEAFRRRGRMEVYPNKTEIFLWDNVPLIKFYPMEINMENGKIIASQPYQVLSN